MNRKQVIDKVRDIWFGYERLWKVFWIYKVLIGGLLGAVFQIFDMANLRFTSLVLLALYSVYHVWVLKGLYCCRFNVEKEGLISSLIPPFVLLNIIFLIYSIGIILLKQNNIQ